MILNEGKISIGIVGMFFGICFGAGTSQPQWQPWAGIWGLIMLVAGVILIIHMSKQEDILNLPEHPK